MATKTEHKQIDLLPVIPTIENLGVTKFQVSGAGVQATVEGVTNTNDIALLDNPCWQKAVGAWLLTLCGNDVDMAMVQVKKAYVDYINKAGEAHRPTDGVIDTGLGVVMNYAITPETISDGSGVAGAVIDLVKKDKAPHKNGKSKSLHG